MTRALMLEPGVAEFDRRAREGNLVPVSCEVLADLDTPISAFMRLRHLPRAFLLESVEGNEKLARYSFLGAQPRLTLRASLDHVQITEEGAVRTLAQDPLSAARDIMRRYRPVIDPTLPRFYGGLVGYFSYDLIRTIERLPHQPPDDRGLPVLDLGLADTVMIFDHLRHRIRIVANALVDDGAERAYTAARGRIEEWLDLLRRPVPSDGVPSRRLATASSVPSRREERAPHLALTSNMTREQFLSAAERCREYIHAGDAFQIVLSQRFAADTGRLDPLEIYRALRMINPSPFMFYLTGEDATILGASPELLVRIEGDLVEMRPIAGTRPRGLTGEEDRRLAEEMLADEKERAEHVMLVDLTRNDIGRVSRYGTVHVPDLMTVERYSHVMHIVSGVHGRLLPDRDAFDVLRAVFPHGTVSGAPKVRAMEILDELEPTARGPYAGAVGYVGFGGALDTCIAIRSLVITGGTAYAQAGAGIVADSVPANEYDETINKAKALIRAIEAAGRGL
jgi:anthranilate synthase component 1